MHSSTSGSKYSRSPILIKGSGVRGEVRGIGMRGFVDKPTDPVVLIVPPRGPVARDDWVSRSMSEVFLGYGFRVLQIECGAHSSVEFPTAQFITDSDLTDVRAALYWLKERYPEARQMWIAGTGFGAYISMQMLLRDARITGFVVVGLPYLRYDFNFLSPCPARGLIVNGTDNEDAPSKAVIKFVEEKNSSSISAGSCMGAPIDLVEIPGALNQSADERVRAIFCEKVSEYVRGFHAGKLS